MNEQSCEQFREQFGEYIYRELTETTALERHLAECSACRRELAATTRALAAVDRATIGAAPEEVVDAVVSGVVAELRPRPEHTEPHRSRKHVSGRWLRAVASLAACLLVGAFGVWILFRTSGRDTAAVSNDELELQTRAVAAEAQAVLHFLDELERENETLVRLIGQDDAGVPENEPDKNIKLDKNKEE